MLPRLDRPAREVAPDLLGAILRVGERSARIVEVEAYEGPNDPASHAAGSVTDRNRIMFGPVGRLYVYRSYGIHWCANIVAHQQPVEPAETDGQHDADALPVGAVLVRAVEPLEGLEAMFGDRPKARCNTDLGSGPGKLCAALGISGADNGADLRHASARVRLLAGEAPDPAHVVAGPRVGITKATQRPWRFALAGNRHVSSPRPPGWAQH
jgi:DNA-3-methyladenine glycosylase